MFRPHTLGMVGSSVLAETVNPLFCIHNHCLSSCIIHMAYNALIFLLFSFSKSFPSNLWYPVMCASSHTYKCNICLCGCLFFPYIQPHFSVDLNQIWHAASLHPTDGHGL